MKKSKTTLTIEIFGKQGHSSRKNEIYKQSILIGIEILAKINIKFKDNKSVRLINIYSDKNTSYNQIPGYCCLTYEIDEPILDIVFLDFMSIKDKFNENRILIKKTN